MKSHLGRQWKRVDAQSQSIPHPPAELSAGADLHWARPKVFVSGPQILQLSLLNWVSVPVQLGSSRILRGAFWIQ